MYGMDTLFSLVYNVSDTCLNIILEKDVPTLMRNLLKQNIEYYIS